MAFDPHKNFAYSTVATAPSPATSGTSLVVAAGDGTLFPAPGTDGDFNVTVWPAGAIPTHANAEICRVTARSTDTLTITRAQESTSARSIQAGDQIALTITAKVITDIETATGGGGVGTGEETLDTISSSGSSTTIDIANGAVQDITLTANCTISLTSPATGDAWFLTLLLRQDGTGSRTVTWPGSVTWIGSGIPPTLQTAASSVDTVVLFTVDGGTTWYGVAQTSASGLRSGTSFPGSPSDGDLFYRTDRRILYEWDNTVGHWLSVNKQKITMGVSDLLDAGTTAGIVRAALVSEDIYIESWNTTVLVSSTNNGSNYWTFTLRKFAAGTNTTTNIGTFSTNADSPNQCLSKAVSIAAVIAAASFNRLDVITTKTGTPGALRCPMELVVRTVG